MVFVSRNARQSEMARSDRWEFCFTESFTTLQGQNGQKRIARAMTKEREREMEQIWSRTNKSLWSGRTLIFGPVQEEKVTVLFVYRSTTNHVSIDGKKRKRLIYIWRQFFFLSLELWPILARECQRRNSFFLSTAQSEKQLNHFRCEIHSAIATVLFFCKVKPVKSHSKVQYWWIMFKREREGERDSKNCLDIGTRLNM